MPENHLVILACLWSRSTAGKISRDIAGKSNELPILLAATLPSGELNIYSETA